MNINLCDLVKAVINSRHGWAVADQFEDTFNGESFEEQNTNALNYIRQTIKDLLESELLEGESENDLQDYADELEDYLATPSEK